MVITVAIPCYKRPQLAERLLNSIEQFCPEVLNAVALLQPKNFFHTPKIRQGIKIKWCWSEQRYVGMARNYTVNRVMLHFPDTELLWIADDDIYATNETILNNFLELFEKLDTGTVAITRKMHKKIILVNEHIKTPIPYIGGGFFIRSEVFQSVGGFSNDPSDERDFGIRLYLAGYVNYRTRKALAVHEQGQAKIVTGGLRQVIKEFRETGVGIMGKKNTVWDKSNSYMFGSKYTPVVYGKFKAFDMIGGNITITDKAHALHAKNNKLRLTGNYERLE